MATKTRLTLDEFLALPEEKPYLEYRRGEVTPKVSPGYSHQRLAFRLTLLLNRAFAESGGIALENLRLVFEDADDPASYLPDVSLYLDRSPLVPGSQYIPSDLAIEIRSPGQSMRLLREKCEYYMAHGVQAAWIIDGDRRIVEEWRPGSEPVTHSAADTVSFDAFSRRVDDLLDVSRLFEDL